MKKLNLYLLALLIGGFGLGIAIYKWQVLKFPVSPREEVSVWTIQARAEFRGDGGPNKVVMQLPSKHAGATPNLPTS